MSMFLRRSGAHSRSVITAVVVFVAVLALAVPAFAATASVKIRVEGSNGTLFSATKTVGATQFSDSTGTSYDSTTAPTPLAVLELSARLGGFPFVVHEYSSGIIAEQVNNEVGQMGADSQWYGWSFRVNGAEPLLSTDPEWGYGPDGYRLHSGDSVIWYYGAMDASPTVARVSSTLVKVGGDLTVTTKYLNKRGASSTLPTATVHVGSFVATSNANGTASFPMNTVGDFGVRVEKPGFIRSAVTIVQVRKATAISSPKASANNVEVGARPVVSAVLTSGSTKLASRSVRLWHRAKTSSHWAAGSTKVTSSTGTVHFTVKPSHSTYYRIAYTGSSTYAPVTSASKLVSIR